MIHIDKWTANRPSSVTCIDLKSFFRAKFHTLIPRHSALYLANKHYVDIFFTVVMVNSCKHCSSSFSDVWVMRIASAASPQIMADRGREAAGEQDIFHQRLRSTQIELRPCTECLCSSVYQAFPVFYLLYHCIDIGIFFSSIFFLKGYISISSH